MSHAQTFDQENLIEISKMDYLIKIERYFSHNYNMQLGYRDVSFSADVKGSYRKCKEKYLSVSHYIHKEGGGLKVVYKVDKEIWEHLQTKDWINK